jgi:hypothetical protein
MLQIIQVYQNELVLIGLAVVFALCSLGFFMRRRSRRS